MDTDFAKAMAGAPQSLRAEMWHTEQKRKQYDIIRVKNPTSEDFFVEYDINQHQRFPAAATSDVPRYMAERFVKHMANKIIHAAAQKKHDEFLAERRSKGLPEFAHKSEENEATYLRNDYPKTTDVKILAPLIDELWVGLVYEFGKDKIPQTVDSRSGETRMTPIETQILEKIQGKRVSVAEMPTTKPVIEAPYTVPVPEFENPSFDFSSLNQKISVSDVTND